MRSMLLWSLVPDEALPLILAGLGFLVVLGIVPRGAVGALLALVLLPILFGPFIQSFTETMLAQLPPVVVYAALFVVGITVLRLIAALVIGRRAADHMTGALAADLVRFVLWALIFPFRVLRHLGGWR